MNIILVARGPAGGRSTHPKRPRSISSGASSGDPSDSNTGNIALKCARKGLDQPQWHIKALLGLIRIGGRPKHSKSTREALLT